ncbi:methionyl-tRNA formyltransferase [Segatella copri]|uniref:methionyl-tRNA formyltransferase n=1 Tax=Segatella copri TaxID=165179 RepID=UPI002230B686|nr:methionyl-tRNA formyltransferase [Segatella copri]MCW4074861.1 methionyl-tRNA formyltransferase [Segatella copri]
MEKKDLRIVFMGTPEFAVESLKRLVEGGYNVVAVVTQPDKPVGRHQDTLQPSQVKQYAVEHGLPVLQPVKMKDPEFVEQLRSYHADLQVVVAFRMLPEVVWAMPKYGTFNVHAALLPQYRGAAPINWAVINGEKETGVTTFFLDHDIDTGRIIMQKRFPIPETANVEYVYDGLMHLGAELALETIDALIAADGNIGSIPQSKLIGEGAELKPAPKIFKDTCRIDFHQPAKKVYDFIRGLSPYPGAWTEIKKKEMVVFFDDPTEGHVKSAEEMLENTSDDYVKFPEPTSHPSRKPSTAKIQVLKMFATHLSGEKRGAAPVGSLRIEGKQLQVACLDEWLNIQELQLSGKKRMDAAAFLNGMKDIAYYECQRKDIKDDF